MNVLADLLASLKPVKRGDPIRSTEHNLIVRALRIILNISGDGVSIDHTGIHIRRPPRVTERRFRARIKASQAIGSINKWEYSVDEAIVDDSAAFSGPKWIVKTGGWTSTVGGDHFALPIYNRYEDDHDGTSPEGFGVTLEGPIAGSSLTMLPIPTGKIVEMVEEVGDDGQISRWFSAPNGYDPDCGGV